MLPEEETLLVSPERLRRLGSLMLRRAGAREEDADLTAHILVEADLRGVETHGVFRIPSYVEALQRGAINPRPEIRVERRSPTTALVDGDGGLGYVVSHRAMTEAIAIAREQGTGWVAVANSRHYGAGAYYAMMASAQDMIGFSFTTGGKILSAPGGRGRFMGINVFCYAFPGGRHGPVVLDMATGVVAGGKIQVAALEGRTIPEGWAVDRWGRPLTDSTRFMSEGAMLPLGGDILHGAYKGFGIALLVEALTAFLSGSQGTIIPERPSASSHFFGALRLDAFVPVETFKELVDQAVERMHQAPRADGGTGVMYPGERENITYRERLERGIPLRRSIADLLAETCRRLGVPFDLP